MKSIKPGRGPSGLAFIGSLGAAVFGIFWTVLPLFARIIGGADAVDAMTSNRSYKTIMSCKEVEAELLRHAGTQFCPQTVQVALQVMGAEDTVCEAG